LQRSLGNQVLQHLARPGSWQARLKLSRPQDSAEREADRIAQQVMEARPAPMLQRACPACRNGAKCPKCREEEERALQRLAAPAAPESARAVPADFVTRLGPGQPLSREERAFFEPRFGCDFSQVRLHTDARAAESAQSVDALAYTVGRDIVFGAGQYAPQSHASRSLLAHELIHTIQQGAAPQTRLQRTSDDEHQPAKTDEPFSLSPQRGEGRGEGCDSQLRSASLPRPDETTDETCAARTATPLTLALSPLRGEGIPLTGFCSPGGLCLQRRDLPFNATSIAQQLREAMAGWGTDEDSIYAALAGRTPEQVAQIAQAYQSLYGRNLQADLEDELTSGELLRLAQYSSAAADTPEHRAEAVAIRLREAMKGWGTDEDAIYAALNGRSAEELNAIKEAYRRLTGRELIDDLRDELSGDELERALGEMGLPPNVYEQNTELGMLSVGNFDFHFKDCKILVWVWLKFQFTNNINATEQSDFKRRFVAAVHGTWAHTGYHLTGSPSCPCGDVPIEVHVEDNHGGYYHKLVDVERATDVERRPKVISDINVNLFTDDDTLAHEFGHVLGLYDEYDGGFFENLMFWHRNVPNDPNALMVGGTELRPRYFEHYRRRVQATAPPGCQYTISSPVPPVP
jgi:hypothetical protein